MCMYLAYFLHIFLHVAVCLPRVHFYLAGDWMWHNLVFDVRDRVRDYVRDYVRVDVRDYVRIDVRKCVPVYVWIHT